jgi:hypothetical protein
MKKRVVSLLMICALSVGMLAGADKIKNDRL